MSYHLSISTLVEKFSSLDQSEPDNGSLDLIAIRPSENERKIVTEAELTMEDGVVGDDWKNRSSDGNPDPKTQITLMNSKFVEMIAGSKDNWAQAGDQLYVDLDISEQNLPVGQKIAFGPTQDVILEITDVPHRGCSKFASRFGPAALRFINAFERRSLRLRGVYARVIKSGTIHVNDSITKL